MLSMPTDDTETEAILADIAKASALRADLESELDRQRHRQEILWHRALAAGASYRDIAKAAGLDHTTVYRTINPRERKGSELSPDGLEGNDG